MEYLIVDTPAGPGADLTLAMMISDLTLLIARPSFLDIAAAARSFYEARALARPATILLNQAQPARGGREAASVARALEALRHTRLPAAPLILHARTAFQTAVARGRSVEELGPSPAADEAASLWRHVEAMRAEALADRAGAEGRRRPPPRRANARRWSRRTNRASRSAEAGPAPRVYDAGQPHPIAASTSSSAASSSKRASTGQAATRACQAGGSFTQSFSLVRRPAPPSASARWARKRSVRSS